MQNVGEALASPASLLGGPRDDDTQGRGVLYCVLLIVITHVSIDAFLLAQSCPCSRHKEQRGDASLELSVGREAEERWEILNLCSHSAAP